MSKTSREILDSSHLRAVTKNGIAHISTKHFPVPYQEQALAAMGEYAKQEAMAFLESIKDYERESRSLICFDERSNEKLYSLYLKSKQP